MASTRDFRAQLVKFMRFLFFGDANLLGTLTGETWSSYTDEVRARRLRTLGIGTREEYPALLASGEIAYQIRCWQIREDRGTDSNIVSAVMGLEIVVHRAITNDEFENIYTGGFETIGGAPDLRSQMLSQQQLLLSQNYWLRTGIQRPAALDEFIEGPEIPDVPTRVDNLISYTVTAEVRIKPD